MSQSGDAPLARQGPHSPRALIANVHDILAQKKSKKKSPTINNYSVIFASLDALDRLLDNSDHIEASLKVFKADLLAELASTPSRTPSSSYASAAASPLSASPVPSPPPARAPIVKTREVTILLDKSCELLSLPAPEIKARVEAAIAGVEKLKGVVLRGVKLLPRNRLLLAVDSDRAATLLKHSAVHWVTRLAKDSSLVVPRCQIVINTVQLSFDPTSPSAAQQLFSRNRSVFSDPSVITEIRWLNPKVLRDPKKKASSLLTAASPRALPSSLPSVNLTAMRSRLSHASIAKATDTPNSSASRCLPPARAAPALTAPPAAPAQPARPSAPPANNVITSPPAALTAPSSTPPSIKTALFGSRNVNASISGSAAASSLTPISSVRRPR
ncbi:hypothetical protein DFH09DRAFT_1079686 [Mycena vulgaris]|nr:hypothetical protein DFH09DRAFT_1079686 [Mycena vulgaris]